MSAATFGPDDVRLGEALYRAEGHCRACCELYQGGRRADAVFQAARPIADVLPWLETELRSALAGLRQFTVAIAQIGAEARRDAKPRVMRKAMSGVTEARAALLAESVGPASATDGFHTSVGVALLRTLRETYAEALGSESLNGYQSAYGIARSAIDLLSESIDDDGLAVLRAAFPRVEPPEGLWRLDAVEDAIDRVTDRAIELGAITSEPTLDDSLVKIGRLLEDVERSYAQDIPALAGRLAASLFVRSFDLVRPALEERAPDLAARLTEVLGVELRRAINEGVPHEAVAALVAEARALLSGAAQAAPSHPA